MSQALDTDVSTTQRVRDVRQTFTQQISMKTPVTARISKGPKPYSSTPEWPIKTYANPSTAGVIEGTPPTLTDFENNLANKTMLLGRFQRLWRLPAVSKEANLLAKQYAVPTNMMQDNVRDKTLELHVDIEATILSDNESVPAAASVTASKTRAIGRWISNADARFTDAATTPASAYRTPTSSIITSVSDVTTVTERNIRGLIQSVAEARKEEGGTFWGVCQPDMLEQFNEFTRVDPSGNGTTSFAVRRFNQQLGPEITLAVTKYKSNFGVIDLMPSFRMAASIWFLMLDMEMLNLAYAQAPQFKMLPDDGSNERGMIDALVVMECLNPQAHGKIISGATA